MRAYKSWFLIMLIMLQAGCVFLFNAMCMLRFYAFGSGGPAALLSFGYCVFGAGLVFGVMVFDLVSVCLYNYSLFITLEKKDANPPLNPAEICSDLSESGSSASTDAKLGVRE